jgi:hypothetical protein
LGNVCVTIVTTIRYYVRSGRDSPFEAWFLGIDPPARAKVATAISRLEQDNFSNVKSVGHGVLEHRSILVPAIGSILAGTGRPS